MRRYAHVTEAYGGQSSKCGWRSSYIWLLRCTVSVRPTDGPPAQLVGGRLSGGITGPTRVRRNRGMPLAGGGPAYRWREYPLLFFATRCIPYGRVDVKLCLSGSQERAVLDGYADVEVLADAVCRRAPPRGKRIHRSVSSSGVESRRDLTAE
jgi:hypothetical protein